MFQFIAFPSFNFFTYNDWCQFEQIQMYMTGYDKKNEDCSKSVSDMEAVKIQICKFTNQDVNYRNIPLH